MAVSRWSFTIVLVASVVPPLFAQQSLTWEQIRERFEATNPSLQAAHLSIDESKASETTAYLRPNPELSAGVDQLDPFSPNPYRPLTWTLPLASVNYLHERGNKRELRRDSAKQATDITTSGYADLERNLLFNLRAAFVQTLQAKAVLALANDNLSYYDRLLDVNGDRFRAGDISQNDLNRLQLQRVQFESDVQSATVNLRTAKIQLLALLNDHRPVDQFDVNGPFDFADPKLTLDDLHKTALENRPDLKAAMQSVDKAKTDHQLAIANGTTDPTFSVDFGRNPPVPAYFGVGVSIPLRIFDRNQGEKARTEIDIARNERLRSSTETHVFADVDSAYATMESSLNLLRPYKNQYLQLAVQVRDTVSFAYQRGGASLLDFLQAQQDYRTTELNYLNLIAAYLNAASQLNLAAGREVIQ